MTTIDEVLDAFKEWERTSSSCVVSLTPHGKRVHAKNPTDCCCNAKDCYLFRELAVKEDGCNLSWNCRAVIAKHSLEELKKYLDISTAKSFTVCVLGNPSVSAYQIQDAVERRVKGNVVVK